MRLRIAATLLLMLQLQPLGGAALCLVPGTAPVPCHDMASHHRMTGAAVQAPPHCADIGMCVALTPGVPAFTTMAVPMPPSFDPTPAGISLHPGDPITPPAPPPQA